MEVCWTVATEEGIGQNGVHEIETEVKADRSLPSADATTQPDSAGARDRFRPEEPPRVVLVSLCFLVLLGSLPIWRYYPGLKLPFVALHLTLVAGIVLVAPRVRRIGLLFWIAGLVLPVALRDYAAACAFPPVALSLFLLQPILPAGATLKRENHPWFFALAGFVLSAVLMLGLLIAIGELPGYVTGWRELTSGWQSGRMVKPLLVVILLVWTAGRTLFLARRTRSSTLSLIGLYGLASLVSVGLNPTVYLHKSTVFIVSAYACVGWYSLKSLNLLPSFASLPSATRQSVMTSRRMAIGVIGCVLLTANSIGVVFGAGLAHSLAYTGYLLVFVIIPGVVAYRCLFPRCRDFPRIALHGWLLGHAIEFWLFMFLLASRQTQLFAGYPALAVVAGVAWLWRGRRVRRSFRPAGDATSVAAHLLGAWAVAAFVMFSAALYEFVVPVDHHFTVTTSFTHALLISWPPQEPFLSGVPLHYHYLLNSHLAAAHTITGVPVDVMVCRILPLVHFGVLLALMLRFGYYWFGSIWVGALAALQLFGTFGQEFMWFWFHLVLASVVLIVPSNLLGLEFFLLCMDEAARFLSRRRWHTNRAILLCLLLFTGAGLRAQLVPVLVVSFATCAVWNLWQGRSVLRPMFLTTVGGASLVFALLFFYGYGSNVDATEVLRPAILSETVAYVNPVGDPSPMLLWLQQHIDSVQLGALLFVLITLVGRLGFLAGGWCYVIARRSVGCRFRTIDVLLIAAYLAGVGALVTLESPFQEQWAFMFYGDLAAALGGALGLLWLLRSRSAFAQLLLLASCVGLSVQLNTFAPHFAAKLPTIPDRTSGHSFFAGKQGIPDTPDWHEAIEWLRDNASRGDVVFTTGHTEELDARALTALVPGLTLYAYRRTVEIYSERESVGSRLSNRLSNMDSAPRESALRAIRDDVDPSRRVFCLSIDGNRNPESAGAIPVFETPSVRIFEVPNQNRAPQP